MECVVFFFICSCLELGTTSHHVQLQLLNVLCWIVTMTMAHVGAEKTRGSVKRYNINMLCYWSIS